MLPQIILDDESFLEITEKAVKQIQGLYPEWTDYNAHDPGITILELLAWFKELQQFHLDQTGEAQIRKYLKLMGGMPEEIRPAETEMRIGRIGKPLFFPKGSRFFAGDICFETTEKNFMDAAEVVRLFCVEGEKDPAMAFLANSRNWYMTKKYRSTQVDGNKLRFPAFGERPETGNALWIGLDGPLSPGVEHKLFLRLCSDSHIQRNPGQPSVPLAEYQLYYGTKGGGFGQAVLLRDTTWQMLKDGFLVFSIEKEMEKTGNGLYWLCLVLAMTGYDVPPVIEDISLRQLKVRQTHTLAESHDIICKGRVCRNAEIPLLENGRQEDCGCCVTIPTRLAAEGGSMLFVKQEDGCFQWEEEIFRDKGAEGVKYVFPYQGRDVEAYYKLIFYDERYKDKLVLGEGTGMPWQKYRTDIPGLCRGGLSLMVETEEKSGCYSVWEEREDFDASGPLDRHFCFDEENGVISFGDCDHGMAPEGKILLAAAHTSLGAEGNVKAAAICQTDAPTLGAAVRNDRDAKGGADREDLESCRKRLVLQRKETNRAVTYKDFEYLVKRTPGLMIENVRAVPFAEYRGAGDNGGEETVFVVVKPYTWEERPRLNEVYRKNILNMLNPRRMIGTEIRVLEPEYIGVTVFMEIAATVQEAAVRELIGQTLSDFFKNIRADFGACIQYSAIYGILDVMECVANIRSLGIDAQGKDVRRSRNGDILLPVNGLAYLKEWNCIIQKRT